MPGHRISHRNVTPIIEYLRNLVRGKPMQHNALRFADDQAARTQPPPNLPGGPYAKTTGIYYYMRDARREVQPPTVIITADQLEAGKASLTQDLKQLTPGQVYNPQ